METWSLVHTRAILVRDRIQPDGKKDISVYKKPSTYLNSLEGQVYVISLCYGSYHCGSTIRIPAQPGLDGVHPHYLSNGNRCDGVCHQLWVTELGPAYSWLIWEDLENTEVRAALINGLPAMPSLNGRVLELSERLGIDVPDYRTMQNQARHQGKWLFDILQLIGVGPFLVGLFELWRVMNPIWRRVRGAVSQNLTSWTNNFYVFLLNNCFFYF